jgi:hypothetical protein
MIERFPTLADVLVFWRKAMMKVINHLATTAFDLQHPFAAREQLTAFRAAQLGELFSFSHNASLFHSMKK